MSRFAKYMQQLLHDMGGVPAQEVTPAPTVRVVGPFSGTPEGEAVLSEQQGAIAHLVAGYRQYYLTGVAPMVRKFASLPGVKLEYLMQNGHEMIRLEPFADRTRQSPTTTPPDLLLLEFIWKDNGTLEGVPWMYPVRYATWTQAIVGNNPGFMFVCGPTSVTVDGYPMVGINNITGSYGYYPPLRGIFGKGGNHEVIWRDTAAPIFYGFQSPPGNALTNGYFDHPVIRIAGPDACNATYAGTFSTPNLTPGVVGPWSGLTVDDLGNTTTYELRFRYKGYKDMNPHRLIPRVELDVGTEEPQFVGAQGESVGWDSYVTYAYGYPDERFVLYDYTDTVSKYARERIGTVEADSTLRVHTVAVDLQWYRGEVGPVMRFPSISGYWRSPRNLRGRVGHRLLPDVAPRPSFFSTTEEVALYLDAAGDAGEAWFDLPVPVPSPRDVTVVGTYVWGTTSYFDVEAGEPGIRQQSKELCTTSITARQTVQNVASPPTELPFGTPFPQITALLDLAAFKVEEDPA